MGSEMCIRDRVQVVGAPPVMHAPPQEVETDSEHEMDHEHEEYNEETAKDEEHAHPDEGIEELMSAFPDDETDIDLTHLRLTSTKYLDLPRFAKTLQRLGLRQNEIRTMRGKDLGILTHLKELDLYDNQIEHIAGLENCKDLEYVR